MASEPQKPLAVDGELELERLRMENDLLHATIERLKKEIAQLAETQRKLRAAHTRLEETFRRMTGKEPDRGGKR